MKRDALLLPPALLVSLVAACSGGATAGSAESYNNCLQAETKALTQGSLARSAPQGPFSAALLATDPSRLATLVRDGLAVSYGAYRAEEDAARAAGRGIWATQFERPEAWRRGHSR